MQNETMMAHVGRQIRKTAEMVETVAESLATVKGTGSGLEDTYGQMLLDEVAHVQMLALELTRLATEGDDGGEGNADGGVFGPEELTAVAIPYGNGEDTGKPVNIQYEDCGGSAEKAPSRHQAF